MLGIHNNYFNKSNQYHPNVSNLQEGFKDHFSAQYSCLPNTFAKFYVQRNTSQTTSKMYRPQ